MKLRYRPVLDNTGDPTVTPSFLLYCTDWYCNLPAAKELAASTFLIPWAVHLSHATAFYPVNTKYSNPGHVEYLPPSQ